MELSEGADRLWQDIQRQYIDAGFPPRRAWMLSLPHDSAEVRELEAVGYLEPRTVGRAHFGVTAFGMSELLQQNEISDEAFDLQQQIAKMYEDAKFPPYRSWVVSPTPTETKAASELAARDFLERFASGGQMRLTSGGQRWIMENRVIG
jgi:uncharacterized protein (DUF2267 family)